MATTYPGAKQRPCANQSNTMSAHLGLILHVQVGANDLGPEFNNPASQASYTWVAYPDGRLDQFCDADAHAWAQGAGNDTYNSVGTSGFPNEPLTEACMATIAKLYQWGHDKYGWPYKLAEAPGQPGFGWHGMGGTAWGGHLNCPGVIRRNQRQHILDLAKGTGGIFAMLSDAEQTELLTKTRELHDMFFAPVGQVNAGVPWAVNEVLMDVRALQSDVAALKAKAGA